MLGESKQTRIDPKFLHESGHLRGAGYSTHSLVEIKLFPELAPSPVHGAYFTRDRWNSGEIDMEFIQLQSKHITGNVSTEKCRTGGVFHAGY